MKKLIAILILVLVVGACAKYEDGPQFSLFTRKSRIVNNWQLSGMENHYSGITIDTNLSRMVWAFEEDGEFWTSDDEEGIWEFKDDVDLQLTFDTDGDGAYESIDSSVTYVVTRLSKKELWLTKQAPFDEIEYKYTPVGD